MKVYLVVRCYAEPERVIHGVFSTREKAAAYVELVAEDSWPSFEIDEWEVDAKPTEKRSEP